MHVRWHSAAVPTPSLPQRPWLRDDMPLVWRDDTTVQVGDDDRRVLIDDLDHSVIAWAASLQGDRTLEQALSTAESDGIARGAALRLLRALGPTGAVDDAAVLPETLRDSTPHLRLRLAPDLAAARITLGSAELAARALDRRLRACVAIHGDGDVAEAVAAALTQGGVGNIVRERRLSSSSRRSRRASAERACHVLCDVAHPDVAADPDALALDVPHLPVCVRGARATIGPFVIPGLTGCLRCLDLHRGDRDPAWPRIAVQLQHRRPAVTPRDSSLTAAAAAWTALQVFAWVDSTDREGSMRWPAGWPAAAPPSVGARLVIALPGGSVTREESPAHPLCGCRWPATGS